MSNVTPIDDDVVKRVEGRQREAISCDVNEVTELWLSLLIILVGWWGCVYCQARWLAERYF